MSKHKAQQFQAHNAKYQNPPIAASSIISRSHWFHMSIIPSCIQYSLSTGNQSLLYSICLPRPSMLVSAPLPPPALPPTPAHCAHRRFLRSPRKEHEQGVEDQKYQELREKTEYDRRARHKARMRGGRGGAGHNGAREPKSWSGWAYVFYQILSHGCDSSEEAQDALVHTHAVVACVCERASSPQGVCDVQTIGVADFFPAHNRTTYAVYENSAYCIKWKIAA